ncbi:AraC family transcriptional regulator [Simiduia agarivorans]|uniref:AraC family transcriptional regulator n=1 Tax=Simiduia agarivorans (strain DSM 21679 / JCM 13881 / BCRC 17597 / SA1) TaxID=1117647 RepID=K4KK80_SIMAS|nr:AraC family transcriptional regulator [Simiduia agarivorans]AFU99411.1 AraC family transcriptional regulator [Simiduia agarivorans SA1 = DSM 21679]
MHYPLISNGFLEGYCDLLQERGVDPKPLFQTVGLDISLLGLPDTLIPFDLHNQLLMLAANRLQCPHFALALAQRQGLHIFGPLATMTSQCRTVGEALAVFQRHLPMIVQTVDLRLTTNGPLATFSIHGHFPKVSQTVTFQDHGLSLAYDLIRIFCGRDWVPRAAYFQHAEPANTRPYTDFFHCVLGFSNTQLALVFDASILTQPIHNDANLLPRQLRHYLEQRHQDDLLNQVKHVIALTLAADECSLRSVAQSIGYSTRTLQRRLSEAETQFQMLVDEVRQAQAITYLRHPYYRLTDVAAMLGYSELAAFTRSFKRWFGQSPQRWRQQDRAAAPSHG